jgi:cyclopropane fatty-acyl-phospholipid synthase-like methyltransferase
MLKEQQEPLVAEQPEFSTGKTENEAQKYYQSDDSYRYYSILYTEDYTGAGLFPDQ